MKDTDFERQATAETKAAQYQVYEDDKLIGEFDFLSDAHDCFLSLTGRWCWILDTESGSTPIKKEKMP